MPFSVPQVDKYYNMYHKYRLQWFAVFSFWKEGIRPRNLFSFKMHASAHWGDLAFIIKRVPSNTKPVPSNVLFLDFIRGISNERLRDGVVGGTWALEFDSPRSKSQLSAELSEQFVKLLWVLISSFVKWEQNYMSHNVKWDTKVIWVKMPCPQ